MIITQTQRFIYGLIVLTFFTVSVLAFLNVHALEIFVLLMFVEFLLLVELTKPSFVSLSWKKELTPLVVIGIVVFLVLLYQQTAVLLK